MSLASLDELFSKNTSEPIRFILAESKRRAKTQTISDLFIIIPGVTHLAEGISSRRRSSEGLVQCSPRRSQQEFQGLMSGHNSSARQLTSIQTTSEALVFKSN
jgi:hypothetical protein